MSDIATFTGGEFEDWPTDRLKDELARCIEITAVTLTRAAGIFVVLERRGEDLTALRRGWGWTFPMIAAGQLAAEAVVRFCGAPSHLKALVGLPLDEQRRIANGGLIEVVMRDDPKVTAQLSLKQIRTDILPVVFQNGEVLPPAAQRANLQAQAKALKQQAKTPPKVYRVQSRPDGTIKVGNSVAKKSEVLDALAADAAPDKIPPGPKDDPAARDYKTAVVRLWPAEHKLFTNYCRSVDLPESEVIRKALRIIGALTLYPKAEQQGDQS
jgi:hypothetical protein